MATNSYSYSSNEEQILLTFEDKVVKLIFVGLDTDTRIDDILQIQYDNLWGEAVTIPVLVNKVGLLRAQIKNSVKRMQHDFEVMCARVRQIKRLELRAQGVAQTGLDKIVNDELILDQGVQLMTKTIIKMETELEYLESLYWGCKTKADQLANLTRSLTPGDIQSNLIERQVNFVTMTIHNNANLIR